ncbi:MAG: LCP family protein, partial [Candidatus Shapirobacteria bacterium]|nr:LCP family protein [Candidatus Shapirobacteria bacterium]
CRYEHLYFDAGKQTMNGEQALKYVRSRNAEGDEGTDFARSQRQQRLILALQKKIFKPEFILNYNKLKQLTSLVLENIKMDVPQDQYLNLTKIGLKLRKNKLQTTVLNDGYLINPPTSKVKYGNQWVLIPASGDWQAIHTHVKDLIDKL